MKRRAPKVVRKFLNSKDGMAALMVRTYVPIPFHEREDGYGGSGDCNLTLSDCGRQITLDFDAFDEVDVKEKFRKIDKIRAALDQIEDALIEYYFQSGVLTDKEREDCRKTRSRIAKKDAEIRAISLADLTDGLDLENGI
jgi:hypothetical protein